MGRQRYDYKARCCTECGCLMTPEAFKYHDVFECYEIEKTQEEIKKEVQSDLPSM